jgi:hypothetical protein
MLKEKHAYHVRPLSGFSFLQENHTVLMENHFVAYHEHTLRDFDFKRFVGKDVYIDDFIDSPPWKKHALF